jgi:hypothetical protein
MIIEIVGAVLLGAIVLWLVLEPLYRPGSGLPEYEEPEDPEESRRGIALLALKEIDFDRATGKLSDTDYEFLKQKYTTEALQAIREEEGGGLATATDRVETLVSARLDAIRAEGVGAATASLRCPHCGPRPEHDARFCSDCGRALVDSSLCQVCRSPLDPDSRFCSNCGSKVAA